MRQSYVLSRTLKDLYDECVIISFCHRFHKCIDVMNSEQNDDDRDKCIADDKRVVGEHDEVVIIGTRADWITASVVTEKKVDTIPDSPGGRYFKDTVRCFRPLDFSGTN